MRFLLEMAWRELRVNGRSLWVFCACLMLGVILVAAAGGLYRVISSTLLADTRILLGGDLEIDSNAPLPPAALDWIRQRGDLSLVIELDTMLGTADGNFLRVELQSVDDRYPLYGELVLNPQSRWKRRLHSTRNVMVRRSTPPSPNGSVSASETRSPWAISRCPFAPSSSISPTGA
jgi:predicted lysophospholipase L1 biosynthesis ABC-type transport system permease subunit